MSPAFARGFKRAVYNPFNLAAAAMAVVGSAVAWSEYRSEQAEARLMRTLPRIAQGQTLQVTPEALDAHLPVCRPKQAGKDVIFEIGRQKYVYTCPARK